MRQVAGRLGRSTPLKNHSRGETGDIPKQLTMAGHLGAAKLSTTRAPIPRPMAVVPGRSQNRNGPSRLGATAQRLLARSTRPHNMSSNPIKNSECTRRRRHRPKPVGKGCPEICTGENLELLKTSPLEAPFCHQKGRSSLDKQCSPEFVKEDTYVRAAHMVNPKSHDGPRRTFR